MMKEFPVVVVNSNGDSSYFSHIYIYIKYVSAMIGAVSYDNVFINIYLIIFFNHGLHLSCCN